MPVVLGLVALLALVGIGFAVSSSSSSSSSSTPSAAPGAGVWQALQQPFTIAPGASVVMIDALAPAIIGSNPLPLPTALGTLLSQMAVGREIVSYQFFPAGSQLPHDWPAADTYGPQMNRYEFTYPTIDPASNTRNTPLTLTTPPLAAWQLVPAS